MTLSRRNPTFCYTGVGNVETMNWKKAPSRKGYTLDPHQVEGVHFLIKQKNNAILADDPRMGKTAQVIRAADALKTEKILVICPAIGREHWRAEASDWQMVNRSISLYRTEGVTPPLYVEKPHILVVSFGLLSMQKDRVSQDARKRLAEMHPGFDIIVIDECHRLKTPGSNRTKAVYGESVSSVSDLRQNGIIHNGNRVWLLTGTPAPNHAGELFTHMRAVFPDTINVFSKSTGRDRPMIWEEFRNKYCKTRNHHKLGVLITGSKNLHDLRKRISPYLLRRRETDVKNFLPDLRVTVEMLDPVFVQNKERMAEADKLLDGLVSSLPSTISDLPAAIEKAREESRAGMPNVQKLLGVYKAPAVFAWVKALMDDGAKKLILFGLHHEVLDRLNALLAGYNPVLVTGRVSDTKTQKRIQCFQEDKDCRVFIGQVQACSEVICLDAANHVAFAETPWVPYQIFQAANRARSRNSKNKILAQLLTLPRTKDAHVLDTVRRKVEEINVLFG